MAFLPIAFSASPKPTVVVVLPSPAGVGEIAVTRISLPSGRDLHAGDQRVRKLRLVVTIRLEVVGVDAEPLLGELDDFAQLHAARNG